MATDKTVTIAGHKEPKGVVIFFGVAAVGVIGYAIIEKRKNASAAASSATTAAGAFTDPAGNTCSAPNPQTGYCPGTPEDTSAMEQLAAGSSAYGISGGGSYAPPSLYGNSTGVASTVPTFTDNGSWAQYVEQALGSDGTDAIAAAIAKYLNGQPITEAQASTVEEAIAIANYPPVSGSGGMPPSLNLTSATPPPATPPPASPPPPTPTPNPPPPTKTGAQVTVPNVVGMRANTGIGELASMGLQYTSSTGNRNPADEYTITTQSPGAGTSVAKGSTVTIGFKQI